MLDVAAESLRISIIIPTLNEETCLAGALLCLQPMRDRGHEIIVVDGGSTDDTIAIAGRYADQVICGQPGRALQMNAGAALACNDIVWFLHADTLAPEDADNIIVSALESNTRVWGRFDVALDDPGWLLRLVGNMMNLRSRLTGIATGDQGLFMQRTAFKQIGGFSDLPVMEENAASRGLRAPSPPVALRAKLRNTPRPRR